MNREEVLAEIRRVASLLGKGSIAQSDFKRHGRVSVNTVWSKFGRWNKAMEAAGLTPLDANSRISDEDLEEELRRVHASLGKVPTMNEYALVGKFSPSVYKRRFQGRQSAVSHCLGTVQVQLPGARRAVPPSTPKATISGLPAPWTPPGGKRRREFGPPLNFRGSAHEPINEQGVVLLFGMVARELEFLVEAVGTGYPDCSAKRRIKGGRYVGVEIEFEFRSSNFDHDPEGCDLIVCWIHDWPKCPVEVLELKSEISRLASDV